MQRKKTCVITCYKYPNYVRGEVIRNAIKLNPDFELIPVVNKSTGIFRYIEVIAKLIYTRLFKKPDVYILTFRGYEVLPFIKILTLGKPLLYDEFINPIEWAVYEHNKIGEKGLLGKMLFVFYRKLLKSVDFILTDTKSHADYSSKLMNIPIGKYKPVPVGADEKIFLPSGVKKADSKGFEVFYYGNMLPLHGVEFVTEAALQLKNNKDIHFTIIGGKENTQKMINNSIKKGASITYLKKVPYNELVKYINQSNLCLGGPFGGTLQAGMVITGKTYQFLACEKPALIGRINQTTELKDKKNCLAVEQRDPEAISEAITWAYKNPKRLQQIAKNGRDLYKRHYSTNAVSKILKKILD